MKLLTKTDKQTIRDFAQAALLNKKYLYLAFLAPFATICFGTIIPFIIGQILATLATPDVSLNVYIIGFVITAITGVLANRIGFSSLMRFVADCCETLQDNALTMLTKRSIGYHSNNVSGKLVSDVNDYPQACIQLYNNFFINLLPFALGVVGGTLLISIHSWQLGLIMGLMSASIIIWALWRSKMRSSVRKERHASIKAVISHISDTITNMPAVKSFAMEEVELKKHRKMAAELKRLRLRDWIDVAVDGSNRFAMVMLFQFIFILYLVTAIRNDPSLLGIGIFAFSYSITLLSKLFQLNDILRTIEDALLNASTITVAMREATEIVDINDSQLKLTEGSIDIQHMSFAYPDAPNDLVFDNFNLSVAGGEKIGLVGSSGGGKSTLMKLLLRFDDVTSGSISIDGQNIAEVTQKSLRGYVGFVPQEPLLFHRSIRENVAYGLLDASDEQIIEASKQAYAHEFILKLPKGYDTVVGERGVKLSGGQRQRIALARAILKDAPILFLDEATSALDSESEKLIQKALEKLMKHRTVIVIAHRLSTIRGMDQIIVIDDGKIVESGTHNELLKQNKHYGKLWRHQSGGFLED